MVSVMNVTMEESVMMRQGDVSVLQDSWEQTVLQLVEETGLDTAVSFSVAMMEMMKIPALVYNFVSWIHLDVDVTLDGKASGVTMVSCTHINCVYNFT
ncbi:hypothetical protein HOLleu_14757 [Holothuria leucospilota]|uniref:Uncharacterized protein n=1 Tax=Holothuria leucospilota TaxID=206669 RepID=A0A9Q1C9D5_HOLLE|nr:hypothetical protein HOLleu_14757 [Holothuria leucospilota]